MGSKENQLESSTTKAGVDWLSSLILLFGFGLSRLLYFQLGLRFDAEPLNFYIQYIDPLLLKTKLLESVYYLHGQPPLFNLFLGLVLKLFPTSYPSAFLLLYLGMGIALMFTLCRLMLYAQVKKWIAVPLTIIFCSLPSTVFYENWLFYSYPVALLFCLTALQLCRFQSERKSKDASLFFFLLAILILTRGILNIFWFLCCLSVVLLHSPDRRRTILKTALLPFLVVVAFQCKQEILFGASAGSSYLGTNLLCRVVPELSEEDKRELLNSGKISPAIFPRVQRKISDYQQWLPPYQPYGVDVLDQELKSTGAINLNHADYLPLSKLYLDSVIEILKAHPSSYWKSVVHLSWQYFLPSWDVYGPVTLPGFTDVMEKFVAWSGRSNLEDFNLSIAHIFMILFPALIIFGFAKALRLRRIEKTDRTVEALIFFMLGNILYVSLLTTLISYGDYNRYRFKLDPFYLVLLGMVLSSLCSIFSRPFQLTTPTAEDL